MKHKVLAITAFGTGIILSGVCAYFSIVGLTTLFAGAVIPVILMGTSLEVAKLVTVSWLYHNYQTASKVLVSYLGLAVILLMFITSMGVFGFLSKSHIDQQIQLSTGLIDEIDLLKQKISIAEDERKDIEKRLSRLDTVLDKSAASNRTKDALNLEQTADPKRKLILDEKTKKVNEITDLKTKLAPIESKYKKMEAEVGPVKYVAELIWNDANDAKTLDKAVRSVIILLILVFDPLAIGLLVAFNVSALRMSEDIKVEFLDLKFPNTTAEKKAFKLVKKTRRRKVTN